MIDFYSMFLNVLLESGCCFCCCVRNVIYCLGILVIIEMCVWVFLLCLVLCVERVVIESGCVVSCVCCCLWNLVVVIENLVGLVFILVRFVSCEIW